MFKNQKFKWTVTLTMAIMLVLTAGCSGTSAVDGGNNQGEKAVGKAVTSVDSDPFTLTIMVSGAAIDESIQDARYKLPAFLAKYPNVKIKYQLVSQLDQVITTGDYPDLANITPAKLYDLKAAGLTTDLTGLIKKNNLDLSVFPPSMIDMIKKISGGNGMIALPGNPSDFKYWAAEALAYNKDIFDKFAVPYPKDNMTWDEVIELSKRFNRTDGGVDYHGLTLINPWSTMQTEKHLPYLNQAGKVDLSNPGWSTILQVMKNVDEAQNHWSNANFGDLKAFTKDKDTAMLVGVIITYIRGAEDLEKNGFNWDIATFPRFADQPVTAPYTSGFLVPTVKSKHPDAVMDLVKAMYSSGGSNDEFENPAALKKHLDAIRGHDIALNEPSQYDSKLSKVFSTSVKDMINNSADVNTTLRSMQEAMQQVVDAAK